MAKKRPARPATPKAPAKKVGRPSLYRDAYADQARKLALLGATDDDLAGFFEVARSTISEWKLAHRDFSDALKSGKMEADARVAESLFRRATGYEHEAVKIVADAKTGAEHIVPYVERYPPEPVAMIFWLKNRRPDLWRDKQHTELSGGVKTGQHEDTPTETLVERARRLLGEAA